MNTDKRSKKLDRREDLLLIVFAIFVPIVTLPGLIGL
jgi:hypothetical protein